MKVKCKVWDTFAVSLETFLNVQEVENQTDSGGFNNEKLANGRKVKEIKENMLKRTKENSETSKICLCTK